VVVTGRITGTALLAIRAPDLMGRVGEIVIMCGASQERGNVTPEAVVNIAVDAEATARVLVCGRPVTMLGLDVT
jgi:inosine-uridine nucleoside N-ribohydrolase